MKKKTTLTLLLLTALIQGCYYDIAEELYPGKNCDNSVVTYATKIAPIIINSCATTGCHEAGGASPDLTGGYASVSTNLSLIIERAVTQKNMPPSSPLSSCEISAMEIWNNAGAKND